MIVVSNASPLTNLAAIGQFDLLRQLFARLHIAEGVWDELNAKGLRWPGSELVAAAEWVERHTVKNEPLVAALRRDLDRGEAESIALALALENPRSSSVQEETTYRFDPVAVAQIRLSARLTPGQRIQRLLDARELAVGLIRGRLRRRYPDLPSRDLNLKVLEEIERAQRTSRRP